MAFDRFSAVRAYAILVAMPLFFSSNLVIGRAAVASVEPWTLAFWRWLLAFLVLLPVAWPGLADHRGTLRREWPTVAVLGALGMWACGGVVYLSLHHTTATNATLIYTSSPVFVLLLEILFRGQRSSLRQVAGIALAVIGVATIILRGDLGRLLALELNAGDLGIAGAAIAWAVYSVVLRRGALGELPTVVLFTATAFAGCVFLLPFAVWEAAALGAFPESPQAWASIAGVALVASVLAFTSYQYGVRTVGPTATSIFLYLMPAYGVLLAVVFLGEALRTYHGAGFVCVMLGVVLATAPRLRPSGRKAPGGAG